MSAFCIRSGFLACFLRSSAICGWSLVRAFCPRAAARERGWTASRTRAVKRTIAAAVDAFWNSGWSRSANAPTRLAKADMNADMGEPSGGLVVPGSE